MSTLSVTNIITANDTTDLTIKTGNTSGPEVILYANGATNLNNIQTLSVGNSSVNTVTNSTSISVGSDVTVNTTAISVGNSTANVLMSGPQLSINGQNVSPVQSFRNKIINGNFDIWQRGTSNTSIVSGNLLADRWRHFNIGSTANVSRQAFTLGQTDVPNEPAYFYRVAVTSSASASNYASYGQAIESVRTLADQTATLSFWAKADASKNIAVEFIQLFGTGGSPSTLVNGINVTTCSLTTSWQKFTITVNIPSISGKTLGSNNDDQLYLSFWFDAGSTYNSRTNSLGQQSGTFDIAQVQLESGSVATPFEMRPLGTELALCQRYYQIFHTRWTGVAASSAYIYSVGVSFSTEMRADPTAGVISQTNSARYPSSGYGTGFTRYGGYVYYAAQSSGGNETWSVTGTASAEL